MNEKINNYRNPTMMRFHRSCRLCHYAGYSNICTFSRGGRCPFSAYVGNTGCNTELEQAAQDD